MPQRMSYSMAAMGLVRARWLLAMAVAACVCFAHGCHPSTAPSEPRHEYRDPTIRFVAVSNVAGALEPCGCTKDQLGGVDHLAALHAKLREQVPDTVVLSAGALLYDRPKLEPERRAQDRFKAKALAATMKQLGLAAWSPAAADFAAGIAELRADVATSGAALLAANLQGPAPLTGSALTRAGDIPIGIIGLSDPQLPAGGYPEGVTAPTEAELTAATRREVDRLRGQGARLLVGLASLRRGDALRLAEAIDAFHLLVIGDPAGQGVTNDEPVSPMLVGSTLVVQTANHLQNAAVVDIYLDEAACRPSSAAAPPIRLRDAGGIARAEQLGVLAHRIRQLEVRINNCERGGHVDPQDLAARKAELGSLRRERAQLEDTPLPATSGSTFRYSSYEVRESLGSEPAVEAQLGAFYREVNERNRRAFADRRPPPVPNGQAGYLGALNCKSCHAEAYRFWQTRPHARAYSTLQRQFKEFNLECVGCHVTGYERPGGSTVTFNDELQNVQCEECHGPGSRHSAEPEAPGLIELERPLRFCVDACHHPPHVEGFEPESKLQVILGPGHGR